ncbi:PQQ-binding-like beta-propeller repeat protein [Fimbriiglobus ruber]|uniref:Putative serine/threonine protein kinase afsK n=1 Tax=Fimbriiglobus ruber TaxID=1908690 RepID=A0A225E2V9_9BACT|nr:PQQ-binding-like beta-propeller repeat protein [Fimbriiglobus ruber]OWK43015.1 putative serine/threonine protein kinase afsK [Fimbriiglobus ruber]
MSRHFSAAAVSIVLFAASVAAGDDNWPQFRGPTGDGISTATKLPTVWSETENIRWKAEIHDKGWSSPIVWGNQVWLTTATEEGKQFFAVCVDRKTGKVIHDIHLFSESNPPKIKQYNSFASPTPVIEEGRVYAHFGSHGTACLDTATAKVVWSRTDLPCDHFRGPASSPVIYKNILFLTFDGYDRQYVAALDKMTGKTIWEKERTLPYPSNGDLKKAFATPSVIEVDGKPQLVSPAAMGTIAFDPMTGTEIWRVIHGGMNEATRPYLAHGLIYLSTGHTSGLIAVKAGLQGDLTKNGIAWKFEKVAPTRPSSIVVGDLLFMVNDTGTAFCLDAKSGKLNWKETLGEKFSASPVYAAGNLYFAGETSKTFVVAADKTYKLVETNKLPAGCKASPAVAGSELFLRTSTHLYCIAEK